MVLQTTIMFLYFVRVYTCKISCDGVFIEWFWYEDTPDDIVQIKLLIIIESKGPGTKVLQMTWYNQIH